MKNSGFLRDAKQVLVFNGAQVLIGIERSVRSTYELTNGNLQAISFACTGRLVSTGGFYFRHVHPSIEIEMSDIGTLKLQDYDKMCGVNRKYHTVREMAHKRDARIKIKTKKMKQAKIDVRVINKSKHPLPAYATELSAGMDIRANLTEPVVLKPLERKLIPTGLCIALPEGYEVQIRPRSGLAIKKGISVLNSPGTIDADYRGEIGVILINLSSEDFTMEDGERIAQMVIARHEQAEWQDVEVLDETERGTGGFGHSGIK